MERTLSSDGMALQDPIKECIEGIIGMRVERCKGFTSVLWHDVSELSFRHIRYGWDSGAGDNDRLPIV
jgi:hypothetical protein